MNKRTNKELSAVPLTSLENTIAFITGDEWVKCPTCGQEVRPSHIDAAGCFDCKSSQQKANEALALRQTELTKRLGGQKALMFTPESFIVTDDNRTAFEAATSFDWRSDNLYLSGTCGTGKTHLAIMIARHGIELRKRAEYMQAGRLLRRIRGKSATEEQAEIDRLAALDILALDDLGAERDTEYAVQILYEVIDGRVMGCRNGLVITSNLSLPELATKLGDDRLPSRLAGLCRVIHLAGIDWRLQSDSRTGLINRQTKRTSAGVRRELI